MKQKLFSINAIIRGFVLFPIFLVCLEASALAGWSLFPTTILTLSGETTPSSTQFQTLPGFGGGAVVQLAPEMSKNAVESGLLVFSRRFAEIANGKTAEITSWVFQIPLMAKINLLDNFALGAGLLYTQALGPLIYNVNGNQFYQDYVSHSALIITPWRYTDAYMGWLVSIGYTHSISRGFELVSDFRYAWGFWPEFYNASDFQVLIGVRSGTSL